MAQAAKTAKTAGKPSAFVRLRRYISDVRAEMKRVVWPSRKEIINSSGIVIVTLIIFIIMISLYDQISAFLVVNLGKMGG